MRVQSELPDAEAVTALEETCGWLVDGQRSDESLLLVVVPGRGRAGLWYGDGLRTRIGARFAQLRADLSPEALATSRGVTVLLDGLAVLAAADAQDDPLGCDQLVWDPDRVLAGEPAVGDAAMALQAEGNDLRVRVEPPTDGDLDARLAQLEEECPGWQQDGDRPADRVIVMVQPGSRSSGLWYGVDFSDSLSSRWEDIQTETMNPRFRSGDFGEGLAAGLAQLSSTGRSPSRFDYRDYLDRTADSGRYSSDRSDSGTDSGGAIGMMVLLVLVAGGAWGLSYLSWKSKYESGETTESFGSYSSSRSGSSRRRSFGGFGGRSSWGGGGSRSSGGGRSGGGRRSGGGSTRW
ncbi:MAG: TPM domain-containing protein [Acidimicrobiia bacterium]|nr:TPM domain-containing protein [Acidimicrobiia bacterium]